MEGQKREAAERLVADFHSRRLPTLTPRELDLSRLPRKADAVIGMRRSGKTYFLFQQVGQLEEQGIPRERTLYVNFEDERLLPFEASQLGLFPEALYRRYPETRDHRCWFFFDEIQNVPGWERFVRRLIDTDSAQVVVSGSSAKLLGKEIATSLRGRSLTTEILPFSFREYLTHAEIPFPTRWPPAAKTRSRLERALEDYLEVGGFPEVQSMPTELRTRTHQDYVDVAVLRDVVERHEVSNTTALRQVLRRFVHAPARLFSVHKMFNDLKSQGLRVGKDTIYAFVEHFEDAFLLFTVDVDSPSARVRESRPRKAYLIDPGLARSFSYRGAGDRGWLLENTIYLELCRRGYSTNYVVTENGYEVDFIARRGRSDALLVQVCADFDDVETREREVRALEEALREKRASDAVVVTMYHADALKIGRRSVPVIPAWTWLIRTS